MQVQPLPLTTCILALFPTVDGNWAAWGAWAGCSVTCGQGTWSRSRTCTDPAPSNGGNACAGSGTESATCNQGHCPSGSLL